MCARAAIYGRLRRAGHARTRHRVGGLGGDGGRDRPGLAQGGRRRRLTSGVCLSTSVGERNGAGALPSGPREKLGPKRKGESTRPRTAGPYGEVRERRRRRRGNGPRGKTRPLGPKEGEE